MNYAFRMLNPADLQRQTLRLYGELIARRPNYGGQLILTCGEGSSASGLPAAVSIAGGCTLVLDPDAATVKSVFRHGGLDFVVNTLDEAVRVLKNEIRKHTPLSVALVSPIQPVLDEMTERGLLPDLCFRIDDSTLDPVASLDTLNLITQNGVVQTSHTAAQFLSDRNWSEAVFTPTTTAELRALDVKIMQSFESADSLRLQWLRRIPHYQRPAAESGRTLWLTPTEAILLKQK